MQDPRRTLMIEEIRIKGTRILEEITIKLTKKEGAHMMIGKTKIVITSIINLEEMKPMMIEEVIMDLMIQEETMVTLTKNQEGAEAGAKDGEIIRVATRLFRSKKKALQGRIEKSQLKKVKSTNGDDCLFNYKILNDKSL